MADRLVAGNGIVCSVGAEAECPEIVRLLVEAFTKSDPLALGAGLTAAEFEVFVALLAAHVVGQGLSIVARSAQTGELAGALLAEDSATPPPAGMESLSPKFRPISDILGRLDAEYRRGSARPAGESAHLYLLGVAEQFAAKGIAQQLVTWCLANAAQRRYRMAVVEATSRISQHIFRKYGFTERVWGSYPDHRYEGKAYFASFAEHTGPLLMDRVLEADASRAD